MGTPSSGPNQAVLSCDDSGLSMTGNIVGIFTFAAALYVAPSIRVELFRRSHQRYTDLIADVSSSLRKLMHTYSRIHHHLEATASDTARTEERMAIQSKINDIYHMPGNAGGLLQKLITPVLSTEYGTWSTWINDLLGRVRFVLREHELQDIREKARRAVETLNEVAADVLVKEPDENATRFSQLQRKLTEVRNEMKTMKEDQQQLLQQIREMTAHEEYANPQRDANSP